jgi:hypothetical protein
MDKTTILQTIKEHLPQLLKEDENFRYQIKGLLAETFSTKEEFQAVLEEVRALREESSQRFEQMNRRFEEVNRRFEEVDQRFEEVNRRFEETNEQIKALREDTNRRFDEVNKRFEEVHGRFDHQDKQMRRLQLELNALSGRLGKGMEEVIRQTIEEFSGMHFREVKQLVLEDERGEVFGAPAQIEFDAYLEGEESFIVEVKSHARTDDAYILKKKVEYAEKKLQKSLTPVLIAASIDQRAQVLCGGFGIHVLTRSVLT